MNRWRLLLLPFSPVYGAVMLIRDLLFDLNVLKTVPVEKPVLAVGNISAGGVGKTPLVELIVDQLRKQTQVGIVSRGYGRKSHGTIVVQDGIRSLADVYEAGDELRQMADRFPDTIVVADERRVRGARMAIALGAQAIILDDGFQHRYLHRDADIVVMTAEQVLRGEFLLPAGNRREPMVAVRRARLIAVTRCRDEREMNDCERALQRWNKPVLCLQTKVRSLNYVATHQDPTQEELAGRKVLAFSGIGSPASFDAILGTLNVQVRRHIVYPDHHWYTQDDIEMIGKEYASLGAEVILTTEKDAVRLQHGEWTKFLEDFPVISVGVTHELVRGGGSLNQVLKELFPCA